MLSQSMQKQRGISLIEALVALLIFAFGLLGLAGVQARAMTEARTSVGRGQAIRLIDDLNERMQVNRPGVLGARYNSSWANIPVANCNPCTPTTQAQRDLAQWKSNVASQLPKGRAMVTQLPADPRQVEVMIAWAANEGKANATAAIANKNEYTKPLQVTGAISGNSCFSDLAISPDFICHVVYLQP